MLCCSCCFLSYGQKQQKTSEIVRISGTFDSTVNDTLNYYVDIDPSNIGGFSGSDLRSVVIKNGKFSIKIKNVKSPGYIYFRLNSNDKLSKTTSDSIITNYPILMGHYLIAPGDDIKVVCKSSRASFSGKGTQKYKCQTNINSESFLASNGRLPKYPALPANVYIFDRYGDSLLSKSLKILNSYKATLSYEEFRIMYIELVCHTFSVQLKNIYFVLYNAAVDSLESRQAAKYCIGHLGYDFLKRQRPTDEKIIKPNFRFSEFSNSENKQRTEILGNSATYSAYVIFMCIVNKASINFLDHGNYRLDNADFKDIYKKILFSYSGKTRDKILTDFFLFKTFSSRTKVFTSYTECLQDAINLVKTAEYKTRLVDLVKSQKIGGPVYDFSFEDTSGHPVSLKSFRGKVVIIDSWFIGCYGCALLTSAMPPVIDEFKNNPNVIFLSLNVDAKKQQWASGIQSGKYTHREYLNVYTNGLGTNHPFLKYYSWNSFPNLMIIDKNGDLFSCNESTPSLDKEGKPTKNGSTGDFIALVKKALEK